MNRLVKFLCIGGLVTLICALGTGAAAYAADPAKTPRPESEPTPVVELPPMIVLENKVNARWLYVSFEGVEILSACSEEMTVRFADIYRSQRELMRLVVPDEFLPKFSVPEVMVLFDQRKGQAMPVELQEKSNALGPASVAAPLDLSVQALGQSHWKVRLLPNLMVNGLDAIASCADVGKLDASYSWTRWEEALRMSEGYVRAVLRRRRPALPEWFIEGATELLRSSQVKDDGLLLSPLAWPHRDSRERAIIGTRRGQKTDPRAHVIGPLSEVFRAGAVENTEVEIERLRANRALFIRWALDGQGSTRVAQLSALIRESAGGAAVSNDLLKACFGQNEEQLWRQVEAYLPLAARRPALLRSMQGGSEARLRTREATSVEVARILGDWQRLEAMHLAAHPEYQERYLSAARKAVAKAYDQGERDPRLLIVSGLIEAAGGNRGRASELLEAVLAVGPGEAFRPAAGYTLARLRLETALAHPAGKYGVLSAEQAAFVLAPWERVRATPPAMLEGYWLLLNVSWRSESPMSAQVRRAIEEGVRLYPDNVSFVLVAAELYERDGAYADAASLVKQGLRFATDPDARSRLEAAMVRLSAAGGGRDGADPVR